MEAVMLVEVLDVHGQVQLRQRAAGVGTQLRIGRSIACDVAIDDAFAAPEHVLLVLQQDGRALVRDLGTLNGTRIKGHRIHPQDGRIVAHAELVVGRTVVRVRTVEESLPPERLFRRDLLRRHRSQLALTGLMLCFAFVAFLLWTRAPEQLGQQMLVAELVLIAGLTLWVASWALVSRLSVGAWQVRMHLSIAAWCVALWMWGYWSHGLAAFAMQWRWLGAVMIVVALLIALGAAYLHIRKATNFQRVLALSLAMLAPFLVGGVWWLAELQLDPRTVNRVEAGARIYPQALRLAPSTDSADFLGDVAALKREANRNRQQSLLESPIFDAAD
ncbi:MAG: FHA domain-containing protein [Steroidobacteraceae bacterium]